MRKEFAVLSVSFALLVACGDETTIETVTRAGMDVVASADDLPECTEENEGEYAFVKADEETRICVDGKWKPAAVSDAGNGAFSCKTEELEDRSGLKIVCNGDSIGVVLNGVNGADGKPGENGKPGESGNDGAPGTGCSIKDRSDTAVVIACGDSTITIDLKLNQPQDTAKVDSEQVSVFRDSLVGYAQKGPFLKGTTVYLYELSDGQSLKPVGVPLTGMVLRDDGYFRFPARSFASRYALVVVEGKYRNEVSGEVSDNPIRLNALIDLSNRDSVNVNVLTHLECERVHHLVTREKYTMEKAKQKAQQEILKLFHMELDRVPSAEDANIFGSTDADAALLAVSILLQGDSSSLALSALLNEISNGISETGKWTGARADSLFANFAEWALDMDGSYFFEILDGYYYPSRSKLENLRRIVSEWELNKTLPDYEKYVRRFFSVESGLGVCGSDSVPIGFVKNVTNSFSKNFYASDYSNVDNSYTRFICKEKNGLKNWMPADDIEKDTMSFGHEYSEGDVKNGRVYSFATYVYQDGNWRRGTKLDSLLVKAGGTACLTDGDTSTVKYNDVYYVCTPQTSGDVVRMWVVASDIYNDTYEARDECKKGKDGVYGDGTMLNGRVNTDKVYVCDNGEFRQAQSFEINDGKACTIFNRDGYSVLDRDQNGNKQYSFYKCTEDGWVFTLDTLNKDVITDSRDGKMYKTIGIKNQLWMAENLNFDYKVKPIDSDSVVYGSYTNSNCDTCGHYYTWAAVMDSAGVFSSSTLGCDYGNVCSMTHPVRGICPEGWHLPRKEEWFALFEAVGGRDLAKMVLRSQHDWNNDENGLDTYGFSVLPAGLFMSNEGSFVQEGNNASFWSAEMIRAANDPGAEMAEAVSLGGSATDIICAVLPYRTDALSVRCLKDSD